MFITKVDLTTFSILYRFLHIFTQSGEGSIDRYHNATKIKNKKCDLLKKQVEKLLIQIESLCQIVNCQLEDSKKLCPDFCKGM